LCLQLGDRADYSFIDMFGTPREAVGSILDSVGGIDDLVLSGR
jgi:hypothetical protein